MLDYETMANRYHGCLRVMQLIYLMSGLYLAARGIALGSAYTFFLSLATLLVFPALSLGWRLLKCRPCDAMEFYVLLFSYLGFTLGGAAELYTYLPGYDKIIHCLSGIFVSFLALALFLALDQDPIKSAKKPALPALFVFFTAMAVAGLFEIGEYLVAPLVGRDLQNVLATGVGDTMQDMLVCMVGALSFLPAVMGINRKKPGLLVRAVHLFLYQSIYCTKPQGWKQA